MTARDSAVYDGIVQRPLSDETTSKHARGAATAGPQDPAVGRQRKSPASRRFNTKRRSSWRGYTKKHPKGAVQASCGVSWNIGVPVCTARCFV